jgi:hypothetical protein
MARSFTSFHVQTWVSPDGTPLRVRVVDVQTGAVRELDREQSRVVMEALRAGASGHEDRTDTEGAPDDARASRPANASTVSTG